jgi:hypothetical protein
MGPFNTGGCLIEVTVWAGLTDSQTIDFKKSSQILLCILPSDNWKLEHMMTSSTRIRKF